jgi:hypothetical protein
MPVREDERQETDVPELAVRALTAAQQRAQQLGRVVVVMRNRELVRVFPDGTFKVLRTLPPRKKVTWRGKVRRS